MPRDDIERSFAGLKPGAWRISSPANPACNCAAWAAGDTGRCWDPEPDGGNHWPPEIPRELSLANLAAVFAALGYVPCKADGLEEGFEKLALYADPQGWPTHVARQLPSGGWTSKLGAAEDIEHQTLAGLEGPIYGKLAQLLRKSQAAAH